MHKGLTIMTRIGIWGFGCVGACAVHFFGKRGYQIGLMNNKPLSSDQKRLLDQYDVQFFDQNTQLDSFFKEHEVVLPSPGIDLRPYQPYLPQCTTELDILAAHFKKPIIAITGTLGKTSCTHILAQAIAHNGKRVALGGNVGIAMLDLIDQQEHLDYAVLELSSFQLEQVRYFAPDIALITNIYPNHLDRHTTLREYQQAKTNIYTNQTAEQLTLLPHAVYEQLQQADLPLPHNYVIIDAKTTSQETTLLQTITFADNAQLIAATLQTLGFTLNNKSDFSIPEHRVQPLATIKGVTFYNDSKSTLPQATLAALQRLATKQNTRNIILFLGGLDKGVDRQPLIQQIAQSKLVKMIYTFGSQAEQLAQWCTIYNQPCNATHTLEQAFKQCIAYAQKGDIVLFSPSGASFDLFNHYEHRGSVFKQLVHEYAQEQKAVA